MNNIKYVLLLLLSSCANGIDESDQSDYGLYVPQNQSTDTPDADVKLLEDACIPRVMYVNQHYEKYIDESCGVIFYHPPMWIAPWDSTPVEKH